MKRKIAVLGAGSWGTVLAKVLADNGHQVELWARREELAAEITLKHTNEKYLPGIKLPAELTATSSLAEALSGKEVVVFVVPSHSMREIAREVGGLIAPGALVVHAVKGFEIDTWKRMSEVLLEELGESFAERITVLSGPSHAEEVIKKCPTTVVVASPGQETAEQVQMMFMNRYFRVYTNPDVIGVEVGGALKNIIALASGLVDGLGFGDNAKAALMTRGLAEIARLGSAMGAKPITFVGLAGVGDLVVTCTSRHSRNWRAGHKISQGKKLPEVLAEMGMVVEGIKTTKAAHALARRYDVEMPIAAQLYEVLFAGKEPALAVKELMGRGRTKELEEIVQGW
ncbi:MULTISPECIES: NAD(P)H-dependent glycerol-3-phosphate dehydrogenase [Thermoactinomyces]|uniref:Glycerol-3-phosphate dehydrogenase [NAD(P)+] n=1 Tax=Thermoactinomyces daqus TaxID=1329516 RepID=A0A7W1XAN0_9BACL|nr:MULTISPECIES: NAD(P)H-dependent glycerol-3-phosphate dehydrogenase [Thermoactinomyces]MBA4543126.1 NAD(P)H-dependent glycerol-3-phosphate dehydrogenase [Thermoactinomyces daqus]MBH8596639.1 NAD(P)H-dependent glycerol-3-phosphate dehydrogenase [Thermoactinomyces sp. CICC 10523]MBH8603401.1 NAD(P)H-dependent glycerol-3-phosphate dehydrogenase [Thermoactinomyces sp. CICC 10522]MBH8607832.1 NAD(P)H-dependent glycerol-3-phosphate dehydrogenase [Thermoactinomyces sp. CICC 10521]